MLCYLKTQAKAFVIYYSRYLIKNQMLSHKYKIPKKSSEGILTKLQRVTKWVNPYTGNIQ